MQTRRLTGWLALIVLVCALAVLIYLDYRPQGVEPLPAAVSTSEPGPDEIDSPATTTAEAPQPPAAEPAPAEAPPADAPDAAVEAPAASTEAPAATAEAPATPAEPPAADEAPPAATEPAPTPAEPATDVASAEPAPAEPEPAPGISPQAAQNVPSFDIVRVEPSGDTVVAGQAAPKARVEILDGDETIAVAEANEDGEWAIPLDKPLPPGTHDLAIRTTSADQKTVTLSDQRVAVSVPTAGSKDVLVVLNAPDAASRVLQEPPAAVAAADAPTPDAEDVAVAPGGDAGQPPAAEQPQATADAGSTPADTGEQPASDSGASSEAATADATGADSETGPAGSEPAPTADGATAPAPAEQQVAAAPTEPPPTDQPAAAGTSDSGAAPDTAASSQAEPSGATPTAETGSAASGGTTSAEPSPSETADSGTAPAAELPVPADESEMAAVEPSDSNPPGAERESPAESEIPAAAEPPQAEAPAADAPAVDETPPAEMPAPAEAAAPEPPPEPAPPPPEVAVATVEADTSGALFVSGRSNTRGVVRVYMEDELLGETTSDADGGWTLQATRDMPAGTYRVRADQVDDGGGVVARAEVPFEREVEVAILKPVGSAGAATGTKVSGAVEMQTLVIKKGDNLWRLSRTWYGKGKRWATLYTANKDQIRNPRLIYPGQVFMVPAGDMKWKN